MNEYLDTALKIRPRGIEAEAAVVGFAAAVMELADAGADVRWLIDRAEEYCDLSKGHLFGK